MCLKATQTRELKRLTRCQYAVKCLQDDANGSQAVVVALLANCSKAANLACRSQRMAPVGMVIETAADGGARNAKCGPGEAMYPTTFTACKASEAELSAVECVVRRA